MGVFILFPPIKKKSIRKCLTVRDCGNRRIYCKATKYVSYKYIILYAMKQNYHNSHVHQYGKKLITRLFICYLRHIILLSEGEIIMFLIYISMKIIITILFHKDQVIVFSVMKGYYFPDGIGACSVQHIFQRLAADKTL